MRMFAGADARLSFDDMACNGASLDAGTACCCRAVDCDDGALKKTGDGRFVTPGRRVNWIGPDDDFE